jgi:hypothetical protein
LPEKDAKTEGRAEKPQKAFEKKNQHASGLIEAGQNPAAYFSKKAVDKTQILTLRPGKQTCPRQGSQDLLAALANARIL